MLPFTKIISNHVLDYDFHADDGELYNTFKPRRDMSMELARTKLDACIADVYQCMTNKWIMFNDGQILVYESHCTI